MRGGEDLADKVLYSSDQYEKDAKSFSETESGAKPLDLSAFKRLMVHDLCANTDVLTNLKIGTYPVDKIEKALANPSMYRQVLVNTSRYLSSTSSFYMRLLNYFSKMGLFNYIIDTYDVRQNDIDMTKYLADYNKVSSQFEKMSIKHEMQKIMPVLLSEDLYCGLVFEDSSDFFILRINSDICKIAQVQDGVYNYKINLSGINPFEINSYPIYLKQEYLNYMNGERKNVWYIPPADKQVCFKFNDSCSYVMPFLLMLSKDIFDLDIYKKLKLQKARVDNYKAIVIEIPIDENAVDKPLLTEDTISVFAEMNKANMPDDVGLLHSVGKATPISFKDNTNNTNNLSDAIENLHDSSGVSSELFNSGSTATAMKLSIENDAAFIYAFYRQCERYFTRFIKLRKLNRTHYKFAIRIHDSTVFNRDTVADSFLKAAQNGIPMKLDYVVSLGQTPNRIIGALMLENDVLQLHKKFIPLSTSYTTSGDEISGRPTNDSQGLDLEDSGEITADTDANDR